MRRFAFMPAAALALGAVGAFLRKKELMTVFDPATGLAERGAGASVALWALLALCAAVSVLFAAAVLKGAKAAENFEGAFGEGKKAAPMVFAAAGTVVIVGALMTYLNVSGMGLGYIVFLIFAAATGISMCVMAACVNKKNDGTGLCLASVIPAVFFCYWLIMVYRDNAGNPVLLDYCYVCLAFAAAAVSFYYIAGFAYGKGKARMTLISGHLAIFLLIVSLADSMAMGLKIVIIGTAGFLTAAMEGLVLSARKGE